MMVSSYLFDRHKKHVTISRHAEELWVNITSDSASVDIQMKLEEFRDLRETVTDALEAFLLEEKESSA